MTLIVVPWPTEPTVTPGGKVSKAKRAGKPVPWLSANVVNVLPAPVYRKVKITWREAAERACQDLERRGGFHSAVYYFAEKPVEVAVVLYKPTASLMDPWAVLEGLKPLGDGLEASGLVLNDRLVVGGRAQAVKAASRDQCRVEIKLRAVGS